MFQFLIKWATLILLLVALARTEIGNRLLYYMLWLSILLLLVTHASSLTAAMTGKEAA